MNTFSCGCKSQSHRDLNLRLVCEFLRIQGEFIHTSLDLFRAIALGGEIAESCRTMPLIQLVNFNAPTQKMWSIIRRARTAQVNTLDLAPQHSSSLDSFLSRLQKKRQGFQQHTGRIIWEAEYEAQAYELGTWLKKNRSRKTWTQSHQVGSFVPIGNNIH